MHLWAKTHLPPTGYDAFRELGGRRHRPGRIPAADGRAAARPARRWRPDPARRGRRGRRADRGPERIHRGRGGRQPRLARRHAGFAGDGPRIRARGGPPPGAFRAEVLPRAQRARCHVGCRHPRPICRRRRSRWHTRSGLCITLHMVKARAVADPSNQHWIRHYCETYPDMQLILAHTARGFNPYHTIEGLAALRWATQPVVRHVRRGRRRRVRGDHRDSGPRPAALRHRLPGEPPARPLRGDRRWVLVAL